MKNDVKDMIKKANSSNSISYLILFGVYGITLFIGFIILLYNNYDLFGIICLLLSILFIVLFVVVKIKCGSTDLEELTFDIEKDLSLNLIYGDRFIIFSKEYILFLSNKKVFKINDILFIFDNGNTITLYLKDNKYKIYTYNLRYKDNNLYNTVDKLIHKYAYDSSILYRDNNFMFSTSSFYDFNSVCGKKVVVLDSIIELSMTNNNTITIKFNDDDKTTTGVYKYNDSNLCNQTYSYLTCNCHNARTNIF